MQGMSGRLAGYSMRSPLFGLQGMPYILDRVHGAVHHPLVGDRIVKVCNGDWLAILCERRSSVFKVCFSFWTRIHGAVHHPLVGDRIYKVCQDHREARQTSHSHMVRTHAGASVERGDPPVRRSWGGTLPVANAASVLGIRMPNSFGGLN